MTRVAAVDCGTNSIRLLVAEHKPGASALVDLDRRMEIVRLGQGVDATGRLAPDALERTFKVARFYADAIRDWGAERTRFVATSATRDASNRDEFTATVLEIFGVEPEVVTGDEEAGLSFAGATKELAGIDGVRPPYLVVDIGGGSTEFVLGEDRVKAARSVDIGCVRMLERHLVDDPPGPEQIAVATADIDDAIARAAELVPIGEARTLVGVAGSVTTVAAIALNLNVYDAARVHHARISVERVREVAAMLLAASREERAALGPLHPGRVDVIPAGALILERIMVRLGLDEVVVSEHDILDGLAWSLV